jgi:hypothetical protein
MVTVPTRHVHVLLDRRPDGKAASVKAITPDAVDVEVTPEISTGGYVAVPPSSPTMAGSSYRPP